MIDGLERAVRVLDLFSTEVPEWSVSEVARELCLPKTTTWEWMRSMNELGLLRKSGPHSFRLGWRAFQLGLRARMTSEIARRARDLMGPLAQRCHGTVQLAVRHGADIVYLEKEVASHRFLINQMRIGERLPAHCTAAGKVLLAQVPPEEISAIFGSPVLLARTPHSFTSLDQLSIELAKIRREGFAVDQQELIEGMCCVAAGISNRHGEVCWALSLSIPEYRLSTDRDDLLEMIGIAASDLSSA